MFSPPHLREVNFSSPNQPKNPNTLIFSSTLFPVVAHEDENLNPGILGRSLADWIKAELAGSEFEIREDIDEDFGRCLMVHRQPYWLWVGVAGASDLDWPEDGLDQERARSLPLESIQWRLWVACEWGWMSKIRGRDRREADRQRLLARLRQALLATGAVGFEP